MQLILSQKLDILMLWSSPLHNKKTGFAGQSLGLILKPIPLKYIVLVTHIGIKYISSLTAIIQKSLKFVQFLINSYKYNHSF